MEIDFNKAEVHLVLFDDHEVTISIKHRDWWKEVRKLSHEENNELESRLKNLAQFIKDRVVSE